MCSMLKRMFRKFCTGFITVAMLVSLIPSINSQAAAGEPKEVLILDFEDGSFKRIDRNSQTWLRITEEVAFTDNAKTKSLEWTMNNNNFNIYSGGYGIDKISANKTVNIRFKANEGTQFNLVYQKERNATGSNAIKHLVEANGRWQTYSIDFEKIKSIYNDETFSIKLDCSGWGFENNETENYYTPGSKLYIDSIWMECTSESRNEKLLFDFNHKSAPGGISVKKEGKYEISGDADNGNSYSLRYYLSGDGNDLEIVCPTDVNWNLYDKVLFRMKADKLENSERTHQKLNFIFSGPTTYGTSGTFKKLDANISVDEWQDVEFNVSELSTALTAGNNANNIGLIRFNVGGWSNIDYEIGTSIYLDSIVLKRNEDVPNKQTVVDFDSATGYTSGNIWDNNSNGKHTLNSTENPYPSKTKNLKWNISKNDAQLRIMPTLKLNLKDYDYVAFRVYSTASQTVGFRFSDLASPGSGQFFGKNVSLPKDEWSVVKISTADILKNTYMAEKDATYIRLVVSSMGDGSNIYIDSVWLEKELEGPVCELANKTDVKPYLDGYNTLCLEFAEELYPYNYFDSVTVEENGVKSDVAYWVSHNGNTLKVIFESVLKNDTQYTVHLSGNYIYSVTGKYLPETSVSFKTAPALVEWGVVEFASDSIPQSGELRAYVTSSNTSGISANAKLMIAVYSAAKSLEDLIIADALCPAYQDYESYVSVANTSLYPGCTYKVFLWSSIDEPIPLCETDLLE